MAKKEFLLMALSPCPRWDKKTDFIYGENNVITSWHTNETAVKYLLETREKLDGIFAFTTNQVLGVNEYDDEKRTHLDVFKDLFADENLMYETVNMPKYLDGVHQALGEMYDKIIAIKKENKDIIIHIDITGSLRHSTMLMLPLMRLLEFTGAEIGEIVYSNYQQDGECKIENAKELSDIFTMVAGAQEFISYGRVEQLESYLANQKRDNFKLNSLLGDMKTLSESLKICSDYESVSKALKEVERKIKEYRKNTKTQNNLNGQEILFSKMLDTIEDNYELIINNNLDEYKRRLAIIKWCLKRGLLQQALTFYTEWVPDCLFKSNLIEINKDEIKSKIKEVEYNEKGDRKTYYDYIKLLRPHGEFKNFIKKMCCYNDQNFETEWIKCIVNANNKNLFRVDANVLEHKRNAKRDLISFINNYNKHVRNNRHKMNHADAKKATEQSNNRLIKEILDNIKIIEDLI